MVSNRKKKKMLRQQKNARPKEEKQKGNKIINYVIKMINLPGWTQQNNTVLLTIPFPLATFADKN
jgi:hemolysin-activating ACP:hemolysin acyltransferase